MAILLAVLTFVLQQFTNLKGKPTGVSKNLMDLSNFITAILLVSGFLSVISFLYMIASNPTKIFFWFIISVLFFIILLTIIAAIFILKRTQQYVRTKINDR